VRPLSRYYVNEEKCSGLLLGFASIEEHEMAAAFTRLATIIRENAV
ncbi:PLP-dependent aminotransferase family protein, partial [Salmonella enterica subsp. enterica serovar 1,4,[5],12:i:-]|nr:PLP-dependent aminotransferase family protein [Salmonella enterica subsp. enterica serovar 1,4,[5],12:i:-]